MATCSVCSSPVQPSSRFCSSCGTPLTGTPTASRISTGTAEPARFTPGSLVASRFRIIGLLGRGGMGEVYRADDLKLEQPVALKFLPQMLVGNPAALANFHNEVRLARQITHPNVCRVHDIGEVDGHHFLSMEYVDGEDLASLLHRIGRMPKNKAHEIARELCVGLGAAHDRGVLHRDLKPANVMIDGEGHVRIMDFGLAGLSGTLTDADALAGTPAYMSPEQLAGAASTIRSDLYALGLVLYEMITGRRAFEAGSFLEWIEKHQDEEPVRPSLLATDIEPPVERIILKCLEKDPAKRPSSALAVSAALPGGDPLALALAAGQTPSPEMVAAAGATGGLKPAVARVLLGAAWLGIVFFITFYPRQAVFGKVDLRKPPQVLEDRAREILATTGFTRPPAQSAHGFLLDTAQLNYMRRTDRSLDRWERLRNVPPIRFWYRQSKDPMPPDVAWTMGRITWENPSFTDPEMARLTLDGSGRLVMFQVVPPRFDDSVAVAPPPDWSIYFREAGLDQALFTSIPPVANPPFFCDLRQAWKGVVPDDPGTEVRIDAASFRGRPVQFAIVKPWQNPGALGTETSRQARTTQTIVGLVIVLVVFLGGLLLALRNLKLGRADRKGALRVGFIVFSAFVLAWVVGADHVPDAPGEINTFLQSAAVALINWAVIWFLYLALEPYVRKVWPETLISWTRLISGQYRDPLVGRDILTGGVYGAILLLTLILPYALPGLMGIPAPPPNSVAVDALLGGGKAMASLFLNVANAVFLPVIILATIVILRLILRKKWLAVGSTVLLFCLSALANNADPVMKIWAAFVLSSAVFMLLRFGFLTLIVGNICSNVLAQFPVSFDFSQWYTGTAMIVVILIAALLAYGFHISLAGRPAWKGLLRE